MREGTAQKVSNAILSGAAGVASFVFSLGAMLYITELNEKIVASIVAGAFCLLISYIASERLTARAPAPGRSRRSLLAFEDGDLVSPAPATRQKALQNWRGRPTRVAKPRRSKKPFARHVLPLHRFRTVSIPSKRTIAQRGRRVGSAMLSSTRRFKWSTTSWPCRGDQC